MSDRQQLDNPLVSIIIPAYNAEAFIAESLNSVLSQTYENIEVLVVDDGSQDKTAEIVNFFARKDQRVILLQQKNAGVIAARNLAIAKSRGEYIAPLDADDVWYPDNIAKQLQCILQAGSSVGLVYAWSTHIDENSLLTGGSNTSTEEGDVCLPLILGNFIGNGSAALIRRSCIEQVGAYNPKLGEANAHGCEDWDLYLRLASKYQFRVIPEFLIGYRQRMSSMSCKPSVMAKFYKQTMAQAQQRHPEIATAVFKWSRSNYYLYLAYKSQYCGNYWNYLLWMYRAFKADATILLNHQFYPPILTNFSKLIAQPITSQIWSDHISWLRFKQRLRQWLKPNPRLIRVSDLSNSLRDNSQVPRNLYKQIRNRRQIKVSIELINRPLLIEQHNST